MKKFILTLAIWFCLASTTYAAELIMFSMKSCGYCRSFLEEVAQEYKNTDNAKVLPLRIISMDRRAAPRWFDTAYKAGKIDGIAGTPTFIVFDSGKEVARLIGYNGKERFYDDISRFIKENRDKLAARVGVNPIPYEKDTEMTPEQALRETMGELANSPSQHKQEGSHSNNTPREDRPNIHNEKLKKLPNGVINSRDIMDHIYKTETEAQIAANWLGCRGVHTHNLPDKGLIFMPCEMR